MNTALSHGGFSSYQVAAGSDLVDPYMRQDDASDLDVSQDAEIPGQSARQWKPRMAAQDAAL